MAIAAAGIWRPTNSLCWVQSAEHHAVASVTLSVPPARNAGLPRWICCEMAAEPRSGRAPR